ncbi:hypothetical protein JRQ81_017587 [Phrynocephalus forsythii]|uniref:Reverse transcriptase n=1 Tax=Phrynocephalus forsythii TaxID=171643 RepID=A0A9Q1B0G9_9SAUR|nr:hypothetical protein JRQ81_017587 [Phrynocephalus forsythii]
MGISILQNWLEGTFLFYFMLMMQQYFLERALSALLQFCNKEQLKLNYQKTKIVAFAKRPKIYSWTIDGHNIEQVSSFKYLGAVPQANGTRKAHGDYVADMAQRSSLAILKYLMTSGVYYIPAALKLFKAKSISQLLYGTQLGPLSNFAPLERVLSKCIRSALQVPKCVPSATLRLEIGLMRMEARVRVAILLYWLRLSFFPMGLASLIRKDDFKFKWKLAIITKISTLGLSQDLLLIMNFDQAKALIKQQIDSDRQLDMARSSAFIINDSCRYLSFTMGYLTKLEIHNHQRAFTLAQCHPPFSCP